MIFPQDTQLISVLLIEIEKLWDLIIIFIIGFVVIAIVFSYCYYYFGG